MSRLIVIARNRYSALWLQHIKDMETREYANAFRGLDGSAWVDIPPEIKSKLLDEGYHGELQDLQGYVSTLLTQNYAIQVVRGGFISHEDNGDQTQVAAGFDVVFSTDDKEYYSVVLHSLLGTEIVARYIRANLNRIGLLSTSQAARAVASMLRKVTDAPHWLEGSYLGEGRLLIYKIEDVLLDPVGMS